MDTESRCTVVRIHFNPRSASSQRQVRYILSPLYRKELHQWWVI